MLGAAARYRRATVGSNHDDAHPFKQSFTRGQFANPGFMDKFFAISLRTGHHSHKILSSGPIGYLRGINRGLAQWAGPSRIPWQSALNGPSLFAAFCTLLLQLQLQLLLLILLLLMLFAFAFVFAAAAAASAAAAAEAAAAAAAAATDFAAASALSHPNQSLLGEGVNYQKSRLRTGPIAFKLS